MKERNIFNFKKKLGEKMNELGNHNKKQKNKRNNLKWTLERIRSNKFLKIKNPQSRNGTREGTITCPKSTKNISKFCLILCPHRHYMTRQKHRRRTHQIQVQGKNQQIT